MSVPLKDFRVAIPESVDIWLEAVATAEKCDKQQVAREVLMKWARRKHHEHSVAEKKLRANGLQTAFDGFDAG